ncbi:bifunctional dihydrofolate reductase-thymidylate synthase [Tupanvirus soda lake]|uniref:Bifunctional dihydrofolate reductase-thymidylate synthase n=2 Tax=Tupanvirus TaxID=2094720 RepID=A0A6N1NM89_9VIRU|nr:bifunctional dihydrofolate reductase-thymidylate synthase [Tupanvirus soda lake]QKU35525.1 bifunctional dihydrofolate reductase-thymidylate synthase [Tupanvirus soda lake]
MYNNLYTKLSDQEDEWKVVPAKSKHNPKKTNHVSNKVASSKPNTAPKKPTPKASPKTVVTEKPKTICFETVDQNEFEEDIHISDEEYEEAIGFVCSKYDANPQDWWAISEAESVARDKKLIEKGLKPKFSDTLREPVIVNIPVEENPLPDEDIMQAFEPFVNPIALVREWQTDTGKWDSEVAAVMKNPFEFCKVIGQLSGSDSGADTQFARALPGKDFVADSIFTSLLSSGKINLGDDVVNIDSKKVRDIGKIVAAYNKLFPIWSFIKVDDSCTTRSKIAAPFIRAGSNGPAINCIDINLKETKANTSQGIRTMSTDFDDGFIPNLVMQFVCGNLPADVTSIVFNKTIAINGSTYYKGYRLRVLSSTTSVPTLNQCKVFIENDFIKGCSHGACDYSKCIVRISCPK